MTKNDTEQLIQDLEVLFDSDYSTYEEVMFPIIRDYFWYRLGKNTDDLPILPSDSMFWSIDSSLRRALSILKITE